MNKIKLLEKMVADWECKQNPSCNGKVEKWSYWDMVTRGQPVCPFCDSDMALVLTSPKVLPEDAILGF